ncbi:MAG: TadE/TadG family type IV pilus assembly protein [Thermomicrobiales bacterium]
MNARFFRKNSAAQGLVEFALVAPLFFLLVFGLVEGGRLIYSYNTVNHSAQEAARTAILEDTSGVAAVRDRAVAAADPLSVSAGDVDVEINGGGTSFADRTIGDRVRVTVSYNFVPVVGMVFGAAPSITLTGDSELMVE